MLCDRGPGLGQGRGQVVPPRQDGAPDGQVEGGARRGEGPTFYSVNTYRFRGHSMSDPLKYRTKEELESKKDEDPIVRVKQYLLDHALSTLDALDAIVAKFITGGSVASVAADLQKAAQGIKDKSAEYYVRVVAKLEKNQDYVQKELARLQGILKKGGLAPEKVDDLTIRTNVLQKFTGSKDEAKDEL